MSRALRALGVAVVIVIASIVAVPAVRADEFSLHMLLSSQTAVTTNAFSLPEGGTASSDPSLNYQIRPGFLFSYHSRRSLHELQLESGLDGNDFTSNVTLTYRAGWRATYSIGPRTEFEATASANGGRVNALSTTLPANMGGPQVLPTGQVEFFSADANESVNYLVTPLLSVREFAFGRFLLTDNQDEVAPPPPALPPRDTTGFELGGGISGERTFKVTAISAQIQTAFQRLGIEEPAFSGMFVDRDQIDVRGTVRVRRDFSLRWSGAVEGGVVALVPREAGEDLLYQPIGTLEVAYFPTWGSAGLTVRHNVAPNLFLAQNEISDSATVNAAIPLPYLGTRYQPKLSVLTSTGYSRTRFVDLEDGGNRAKFDVIYSDVAFQYTPKPSMQLAVRYQFIRQSDTETPDPDPMLQQLAYIRHTILFTFFARWPDRLAAEMPIRSQLRVRDITPVGEEPGTGITGGPAR
jgi:hypothetical protein